MPDQQPVYLDENGEPIVQAAPVYLDERGEPLTGVERALSTAKTITAPPAVQLRDFAARNRDNPGSAFTPEAEDLLQRTNRQKTINNAGALPSVLGMIGGLVGRNPVAAGAGGVTGEALRQVVLRDLGITEGVPETPTEQLASMGVEGGMQAAADATGRYLVTPAAKTVYGLSLRPNAPVRRKYGTRALVEEGFNRRVMPTQSGAAKATQAMQESRATQRGMAQTYDASGGAPMPVSDAVRTGVRPLIREASQQEAATGAQGARQRIVGNVQRVAKKNPKPVSATKMMDLKHAADDVADPAYKQAAMPGGAPVMPGSEAAIAKGFSKGYRQTLNDAVGPEFAAQGRQTKTLFGLSRAAQDAGERPQMLTNLLAGGIGAAQSGGDIGEGLKRAVLFRTLFSPNAQALASFAAPALATYGPRAVDAATGGNIDRMVREALLRQMLAGEQ